MTSQLIEAEINNSAFALVIAREAFGRRGKVPVYSSKTTILPGSSCEESGGASGNPIEEAGRRPHTN